MSLNCTSDGIGWSVCLLSFLQARMCELEWNRTRCHENQTGGGGIPRLAHKSLQPITDLHAGQDAEGEKSESVYQHCSPLICTI